MKKIIFYLAFSLITQILFINSSFSAVLRIDKEKSSPEPIPVTENLPIIPNTNKSISSLKKIFIKQIVLENNQVLSSKEITTITKNYENRTLRNSQLHQVRSDLSKLIYKKGFVNSGVIIPDQKIVKGILKLHVINGSLSTVNLSGLRRLKKSYILDRVRNNISAPLNVNTLNINLQALQQDSRIDKITAKLQPGEQPGTSLLDLKIKESRPYDVSVGVNNHRSPSIGANRGYVNANHLNVLGWGDNVSFEAGLTEGVKDLRISYAAPFKFKAKEYQASFSFSTSDSIVIEEPFDAVDITSETNSFGIALNKALLQGLNHKQSIAMGMEIKENKTTLLDTPFSFSPGVNNGESKVSVLNFSYDKLVKSKYLVDAYRANLRLGIDAFDSTINSETPDSEFVLLQGQYQKLKKIEYWNSVVTFIVSGQITGDDLLPLEKFSIGGHQSVKGYRENQFVRDNGLFGSIQLEIPLREFFKHQYPLLSVVPFIDTGLSWDSDDKLESSHKESISSLGAGLNWKPTDKLFLGLFVGLASENIKQDNKNLQDSGVHFNFSYQLL